MVAALWSVTAVSMLDETVFAKSPSSPSDAASSTRVSRSSGASPTTFEIASAISC